MRKTNFEGVKVWVENEGKPCPSCNKGKLKVTSEQENP